MHCECSCGCTAILSLSEAGAELMVCYACIAGAHQDEEKEGE